MTIATPSAKAHERVTGRWTHDSALKTKKDWFVYSFKQIVGTPIPLLMFAIVISAFCSRAAVEVSAWLCAGLTILYILADRISAKREFGFFRVGYDIFLIGYVVIILSSACLADTVEGFISTLGSARWVLLLYSLTYCWKLFPGLNRIFLALISAGTMAAIYGIWQHFTGVDLISGTELASAPVLGAVFFTPISFFNTPENFGTLLCMALPFPVAYFLLDERRTLHLARYAALAICLTLVTAIIWTYRPGIWITAVVGLIVCILMQFQNGLKLIFVLAAFVFSVLMISYGSPTQLNESIEKNELLRTEKQRTQINAQVKIWEENRWVGAGKKSTENTAYDPGTGNVYFQQLAHSGMLGSGFYLFSILGFLLLTYQIFNEIPKSHFWHRVIIVGALASQISFHVAGLYWATFNEALTLNLFVFILAVTSYVSEKYRHGLVPDDHAL